MNKLFGSNGIRGIVNKDLTPSFILDISRAIGTYFGKNKKILISRDYRFGGEFLEKMTESGLLISGIEVFESDPAPIPALQFCIKTMQFDGGIMITASHNPYQFNGIKVIGQNGIELERKEEEKIEKIFHNKSFSNLNFNELKYNVKKQVNIIPNYVNAVLSNINKQKIRSKRFKVLIDPINSVGAITSSLIAKELNCKIYWTNKEPDPLFPKRQPEPNPDTLTKTARIAKSLKVDLAIAHDADADRIIFIDNKGRIQFGDRSGTLIAKHLCKKFKDNLNNSKITKKVITAVSSSVLVEEFLNKSGIDVVWTKVGAPTVSHALLKQNGLCGFEDNGGFLFPMHQYVRDGGMTFALMLELLSDSNLTSSQLFDTLPKYYPIKTKIPVTNNFDLNLIEAKIKKDFKSKIKKIVKIDGLKIIGDDFWFLIRKSGTEPIIRIMAEAKDKNHVESIVKNLKQIILGS